MNQEPYIPDYARRDGVPTQPDGKRLDPFRIPRMMMYVWILSPVAIALVFVVMVWVANLFR